MSLERFFDPRTIAVVGASNAESKMGNRFMRHLAAGFAGTVYPVHPAEREIEGRRAWPTLAALPEDVDLLIALVPAARLLEVLQGCPPGRARFLLAVPSGFGEVSPDGAALERELVDAALARGMRVVGPNTVGMLNGSAGLNASMVPPLPAAGPGVSCATQSGGFAMATWMYAQNHGVAVNKLCDLGNTTDVDVADVLRHFRDDAATEVVGLFLESSRQPVDFAGALAELATRKPVVVARTGASADGRRASLAHVGTAWERHDALPADVAVVETGLDVLHAAKALSWQARPRGRRVAILTGSGGVGAELTDLCAGHGLSVTPLSDGVRARLGAHLPGYAARGNPVDVTPIWWQYARLYPPLLAALLAAEEVDLVIATVIDVASELAELAESLAAFEAQRRAAPAARTGKPVYVYFGAPDRALQNRRTIEAAGLPCYASTSEIVRVAAAVAPASRS